MTIRKIIALCLLVSLFIVVINWWKLFFSADSDYYAPFVASKVASEIDEIRNPK